MINQSSELTISKSNQMPKYDINLGSIRLLFLTLIISALCFGPGHSLHANVSPSRLSSGIELAEKRSEFLEFASRIVEEQDSIRELEANGHRFFVRFSAPPAEKALGVLILVQRDEQLLSKNLASNLQLVLGLDNWSVMLASLEGIDQLDTETRAATLIDIAETASNEIQTGNAKSIIAFVSGYSEVIVSAVAENRLSAIKHLVFIENDAAGVMSLPARSTLSELNTLGIGLLDLVTQNTDKRLLAMRRQLLQQAGFEKEYRLMLVPAWGGEAQYTFLAKRLKVWLRGLNLLLASGG